jgi:hypothetical protein
MNFAGYLLPVQYEGAGVMKGKLSVLACMTTALWMTDVCCCMNMQVHPLLGH